MPRTPNVRRNVARSSPIGELPIDAFWRRWIENARQKNDARDAAQQQPPPSTAPTNTQPAAQPSAQPSNTQMTHPETQPTVQPIARSISRPTVQPKTEPPPQPAQRTPAKPTKPAKPPGLPSGKRHLPKNIRFVTIRHRRDWGHHQRFIGPSTRTIVLGPYFTLIDHILDNIVALGPEICHGIERFSFRYMYPRSRFDAARVTDEALINFASACPNLTMLSIPGLSEATGASMVEIYKRCPKLHYLALTYAARHWHPRVNGDNFHQIAEFPHQSDVLRTLRVSGPHEERLSQTDSLEYMDGVRTLGRTRQHLTVQVIRATDCPVQSQPIDPKRRHVINRVTVFSEGRQEHVRTDGFIKGQILPRGLGGIDRPVYEQGYLPGEEAYWQYMNFSEEWVEEVRNSVKLRQPLG